MHTVQLQFDDHLKATVIGAMEKSTSIRCAYYKKAFSYFRQSSRYRARVSNNRQYRHKYEGNPIRKARSQWRYYPPRVTDWYQIPWRRKASWNSFEHRERAAFKRSPRIFRISEIPVPPWRKYSRIDIIRVVATAIYTYLTSFSHFQGRKRYFAASTNITLFSMSEVSRGSTFPENCKVFI